ncbi:MAG TPA: HAMP domain-containing sensor histidine kinase [Anaerolineae bacterium]|nr:HAMP domain-containing sensor histidine kinase [Anaerolineae bacterium]
MRRHSIRWRLTLSYAAIALLAALALGLILLMTVRSYYQQREQVYLLDNAQGFTLKLAAAINDGSNLQELVEGLSFVVQARIRLLGQHQEVLADSGSPQPTEVTLGTVAVSSRAAQPPMPLGDRFTVIAIQQKDAGIVTETLPFEFPMPDEKFGDVTKPNVIYRSFSVAGPTFGLGLKQSALDEIGGRSDQIVSLPMVDASGQRRGWLELSEGPAYGSEIVKSVAIAWALAGSIAVGLAAIAGWLVSRRLSQPIVALTQATAAMSQGDLSRRARVAGRDEIGTLAHSFNEMADRVEETITALRRFVSDAAHELHSPLTALQTDLELSASEQDETRRANLIAQAQQQAVRLRELADNLLDLSRVEASGAPTSQAEVNLNDLLRDLSEPYASQADQAGLALLLDLAPEVLAVRGDAGQLHRAIGNLIDNAIKVTPEGGTITLGSRRNAGLIEVCIQDTGIGIPTEDLPQLFNRFHRGRNVARYPGNGLGLAIVKAIVEAHGGQVSAANTSPGARFCLTLPGAR